MERISDGIASR